MDFSLILKAGFMGFALSMGVLILVFYVVGGFVQVSGKNFVRVFVLAAVASFLAVYLFLHYRLSSYQATEAQIFLAGCVGGWLAGIFSGLTTLKRLLLSMRR
jgi:heme/copper-type cytochrome/quinol oxidase subunit 4